MLLNWRARQRQCCICALSGKLRAVENGKLCVKCKIHLVDPLTAPLTLALRVHVYAMPSSSADPSPNAPTFNSLARPLNCVCVNAWLCGCVCVCSALQLAPVLQHPFKQIKHKNTKWTPLCRRASHSPARVAGLSAFFAFATF